MASKVLEDVSTIVLTLAALIVAGTAVWQRLPHNPAPPPTQTAADWKAYAKEGNVMGPASARVTVIEFSDFQCPYCARAKDILAPIRAEHALDVKLVYRHYPIVSLHPHAYRAAIASECAALQGRFEPYHDELFRDQRRIGTASWTALAVLARVSDTSAFRVCVERELTRPRVESDIAAARKLQIRGTPLIIVNGMMLMTVDSARIRLAVENALR